MVLVSTRRAPSTTIESAVCARSTSAGKTAPTIPPSAKQTTLSLRQKPIRNAPLLSWSDSYDGVPGGKRIGKQWLNADVHLTACTPGSQHSNSAQRQPPQTAIAH